MTWTSSLNLTECDLLSSSCSRRRLSSSSNSSSATAKSVLSSSADSWSCNSGCLTSPSPSCPLSRLGRPSIMSQHSCMQEIQYVA
ncbi:hypothetical protein OE88DRAFT_1166080 [Heliocybe sulcata]|uniref:Uncharacterized protein n=1 Tax=Heliocybe sulcata TaxID=5364 RepID=A0A5C3NBG8_9AGAM|nr:hypothetical protein OE88DRAFT_1166080 [Heliocybe sulcata]